MSGSSEMERPTAPHSVDDLARSFERHLRAENNSPRTIETYLEALSQFAAHLTGHGSNGNRGLAQAQGQDVEAFIVELVRGCPRSGNSMTATSRLQPPSSPEVRRLSTVREHPAPALYSFLLVFSWW